MVGVCSLLDRPAPLLEASLVVRQIRVASGTVGSTPKRSVAATLIAFLLLVSWVGEWPIELDYATFYGLWRSPFAVFGPLFEPLPGIRVFTWQLLLISMVLFCRPALGSAPERAPDLDRAIVVSVVCVIVTVLWGWLGGGSLYFAYYQVWRFLCALLVAHLLMSAMRSSRDLLTLAGVIVLAALIRGVLVIYFYWEHI